MKRVSILLITVYLVAVTSISLNAQSQTSKADSTLKMTFFGIDTAIKRNKSLTVFHYNQRNELIQADYYQWLENLRKWNHRSRSKISYYGKEIVERQFSIVNDVELKGDTKKYKLDDLQNIIEITREKTIGAKILLMERHTFKYKVDTLFYTSTEYRSTTFFKQSESEISYSKESVTYKTKKYKETEPGTIENSLKKLKFSNTHLVEKHIMSSSASEPDTLIVYNYDKKGRLLSDTTKVLANRIPKRTHSLSSTQFKYDDKGNLRERITMKLNKDGLPEKQYTNEITIFPVSTKKETQELVNLRPSLEKLIAE